MQVRDALVNIHYYVQVRGYSWEREVSEMLVIVVLSLFRTSANFSVL